jgi:hypothetical protein
MQSTRELAFAFAPVGFARQCACACFGPGEEEVRDRSGRSPGDAVGHDEAFRQGGGPGDGPDGLGRKRYAFVA